MVFNEADVSIRLKSLGYDCDETTNDSILIAFCIDKASTIIKNNCNINNVPEGLKEIAIDIACGEFLMSKKTTGQSMGSVIDRIATSARTIELGTTRVDFGSSMSSTEARLQKYIEALLHVDDLNGLLTRYRKLSW